jgi:hypothetical protein
MRDEDADHERGGEAVDVPRRFETAEKAGKNRRPFRVGEFERHACKRETHETDDHDDMQDSVQANKTLNLSGSCLCIHRSIRSVGKTNKIMRRGTREDAFPGCGEFSARGEARARYARLR